MTDADLQKIFKSKFAPLKQHIAPAVCTVIDSGCASYFDEVLQSAPIVPMEEVVSSLVGHWQKEGLEELVALEREVRRMAADLRAPDAQEQELSDFIYAMY